MSARALAAAAEAPAVDDALAALGKLLAVFGFVAADGFFVAAEFALVGVRRIRIEEFELLVAASRSAGLVDQARQDVVERAFAMGARRVRAIMTPRHEQIVVARGALDEVAGILREQDLPDVHLDGELPGDDSEEGRTALLRAVRPSLVVHDGATVAQVLDMFKQRLVQIGLIYDEDGALRGIVTGADLLEALAGDIVDTDDDPAVIRRDDGAWLADGTRPYGDVFAQVGITALPADAGEYRTIAGFVLSRLGRVPVSGDRVETEIGGAPWQIEVTRMEGRRIDEVVLHKGGDAPPRRDAVPAGSNTV